MYEQIIANAKSALSEHGVFIDDLADMPTFIREKEIGDAFALYIGEEEGMEVVRQLVINSERV